MSARGDDERGMRAARALDDDTIEAIIAAASSAAWISGSAPVPPSLVRGGAEGSSPSPIPARDDETAEMPGASSSPASDPAGSAMASAAGLHAPLVLFARQARAVGAEPVPAPSPELAALLEAQTRPVLGSAEAAPMLVATVDPLRRGRRHRLVRRGGAVRSRLSSPAEPSSRSSDAVSPGSRAVGGGGRPPNAQAWAARTGLSARLLSGRGASGVDADGPSAAEPGSRPGLGSAAKVALGAALAAAGVVGAGAIGILPAGASGAVRDALSAVSPVDFPGDGVDGGRDDRRLGDDGPDHDGDDRRHDGDVEADRDDRDHDLDGRWQDDDGRDHDLDEPGDDGGRDFADDGWEGRHRPHQSDVDENLDQPGVLGPDQDGSSDGEAPAPDAPDSSGATADSGGDGRPGSQPPGGDETAPPGGQTAP